MRRFVIVGSLLLLAGCVTAEEAAQQRLANVDRSCTKMGYVGKEEHLACMRTMLDNIAEMRAESAARSQEVANSLQQMGASLQSISLPPPRTITCSQTGIYTNCNY
jgi:hypothetical protein